MSADESNAVVLARVSSKAQEDEGYSLDAQQKLIEDYCNRNGFNIVKVFKIAETASKQHERKVFHEMLAYIAKSPVYHLAVEKTDRFTRNFRDAVAIDDWLEKDDRRRLHAVKESLVLHKHAKSDVKFMWNIHISVAKKYADNLREESMKGWAEKLAQGWMPSPPPPGYKQAVVNGKKIHVINPETKNHIIAAFKYYLEPGRTIKSVCDELRRRGITNHAGRYFSKSRTQWILTNKYYIGTITFDGKQYPGAQELFIPKDLFERVQQKMRKGRPPKMVKHVTALQGMIRCDDCGSMITWQLQKGRYYGVCRRLTEACKQRKMLREDKVEELIMEELKRLSCLSPAIIDWVIASVRSEHDKDTEQKQQIIKAAETQIKRIKTMDESLYDDKLSGEISKERYEVKHGQFMTEKAAYEKQIGNLDGDIKLRLEHRILLLKLSQKAAEIYASRPPEQKRLIISKLFNELSLKSGRLSVTYTNFVQVIAEKVVQTTKLMEV